MTPLASSVRSVTGKISTPPKFVAVSPPRNPAPNPFVAAAVRSTAPPHTVRTRFVTGKNTPMPDACSRSYASARSVTFCGSPANSGGGKPAAARASVTSTKQRRRTAGIFAFVLFLLVSRSPVASIALSRQHIITPRKRFAIPDCLMSNYYVPTTITKPATNSSALLDNASVFHEVSCVSWFHLNVERYGRSAVLQASSNINCGRVSNFRLSFQRRVLYAEVIGQRRT